MSVEFDENEAMEEGTRLSNVGWSYQLLLACEAMGPVKSFTANQEGTWTVEYFERQAPREIPDSLMESKYVSRTSARVQD